MTRLASSWAQERETDAPEQDFVPGASRRGELASVDWRFLLPTLRWSRVLVWGVPGPALLRALAAQAHRGVLIASPDGERLRKLEQSIEEWRLEHVSTLRAATLEQVPATHGTYDLIVCCDGSNTPCVPDLGAQPRTLAQLLRPGGMIYYETSGVGDALRAWTWARRAAENELRIAHRFWLYRHRIHLRCALPLRHAPQMARYFCDHVLYARSTAGRLFMHVARVCARVGVLHLVLPRRGVVVQRGDPGATPDGPLAYVATRLAAAGLGDYTPAGIRTGFFAHGLYDANKVAYFVFDQAKPGPLEPAPEVIVKMTRTAQYNNRLEREYRSLTLLERGGFAEPGSYPQALFLGHYHGLAVLGQRVVHGAPFRTQSTSAAHCPLVRAAVDWLTRLGAASADRTAASSSEIVDWLQQLYTRFAQIYPLSPDEAAFLRDQLAVLARLRGAFPLVFRHGDAGTWNVLAAPDGRIVFLDWEISEPRGMPLWDLLEFLRSCGSWAAHVQGVRDPDAMYTAIYLTASPLNTLQSEAVERYCAEVGLPKQAVAPLFYTCWLYRALQEARRTQDALERGPYFRLLRLCIQHRNSPGLQWMFA